MGADMTGQESDIGPGCPDTGADIGQQCPDRSREPDTFTIPAAAAALGMQERTLRRWVASGRVESLPDGAHRVLTAAVVASLRAAQDRTAADIEADTVRTPKRTVDTVSGQCPDLLRQQLAGARLAAKAAAVRLGELRGALTRLEGERRAERERYAGELAAAADREAWLRGQLDQARTAEAELRILLQAEQRTVATLTERQALPAPRRRSWWPWRRT
jgi:hypothetical protein